MNQLTALLDQLSPTARLYVAIALTLAGVVLTAVGGVRSDATLTAVGSTLLLAGGVVTPTGSGRPRDGDP